MPKKNLFTTKNQLEARVVGKYHSIAESVNKCVFCDLKDQYIIHKGKEIILTVNLFPYIDGQLLVVPKRHVEVYPELSRRQLLESHEVINAALDLLEKELGVKNTWVILRNGNISGKTVKHLHWNIMPYIDDLNTWHYQEITIKPLKLARRLRSVLQK